MDSMPKARPSFFKVLIDFDLQLRLPHDFVQKYGDILPENAKLRTRSSGKTWVVKLEHTEVEKYYFTGGWKKFSEDLGLEMGEFLVFWLSGKSTFDVSVYGISGCEREISACDSGFEDSDSDEKVKIFSKNYTYTHQNLCDLGIKQSKTCNSDKEANGTDTTAIKMNPLYFELVLKDHHRSRVFIPKKFAETSGLIHQKSAVLEYVPKQRFTSVVLESRASIYRLGIAGGWNEFKKRNGLALGKTYSFEFNSRKNVIEINEIKK